MKIKLVQMNIGSKFRFMPYTASGGNVYNKPRDGWISETSARKWAMQNGHEIVNVEKISSNGEKIFKFTYTYVNRLGREITKTTELVGKSEADLKQRILDGLKYNGDTFKSWGKVQTKDSVDSIREKYLGDKRQTGQLGVLYSPNGKAYGTSAKNYGKGTSAENNPEMVNKSFLRQATKNGNFEFENFKEKTESLVAELNTVIAKHLHQFSGDKPMMAAIKNVRNSISTLTKFAQQRRNMMYKTKLDMF